MIQACCFLLAFHLSAFIFWMITAFQPFLAVYSGLPKYVYQTFPATLQDIVQNGRLTPGMAAVVRRDPDSTGLHVFIYEHKSIVDWQAARWLQNHQTTLTIFHWIIHWNWDTAWHFSFVFLCWGGCQKPSENQATSLHYPLENIWLIFMKGQQDSFSAGGPVLQWSLHALPTECARHPADQLRAGRSSAVSLNRERAAAPGHWGSCGSFCKKKAKVYNTVL